MRDTYVPQGYEARAFGDVLRKVMRGPGMRARGRLRALNRAWDELVGESIAAQTRIRSFGNGQLVVEVDSSVLLHELSGFLAPQLVDGLQAAKAGRDIVKLRFCLMATRDDVPPMQ
jgi:hypothetical protein